MSAKISEEGAEEEQGDPAEFDLDAREDKVWSMPNGDFVSVQLGKDPIMSIKVGTRPTLKSRETLIGCIQDNANLSAITPKRFPASILANHATN